MKNNYFGMTDIGLKRSTNQDYFYTGSIAGDRLLCIVCDGMGGANGGSVASSTAIEAFSGEIGKELSDNASPKLLEILPKALDKANRAVYDRSVSDEELSGMGTTIVALLSDGGKYYCLSVGDSRIYVFKDGTMEQLSHDHSYVQTLVDSGQITKEQARVHPNRNIITKAVGTHDEAAGDLFVISQENIDGVLLCSDGLHGYTDEACLCEAFYSDKTPEGIAKQYIDMAKEGGGGDNITCVVIKKQTRDV